MTSLPSPPDDPVEQRIRELHHRTKNDLQGVAGLLQASAGRHPQAAKPLHHAAAHIQALAHVHGLQMHTQIGVPVDDLVRAIADHQASLAGLTITWPEDQTPSDASISAADAVSIGLVVTELILNAIASVGDGGVLAAQTRLDDAHWRLTLRNTGKLPDGFDFTTIGRAMHGLGLAKSLTPRRGAALNLQQEGRDVVATLDLQAPALLDAVSNAGVKE